MGSPWAIAAPGDGVWSGDTVTGAPVSVTAPPAFPAEIRQTTIRMCRSGSPEALTGSAKRVDMSAEHEMR
jgi:hypothetical protein